jgi:periplasmic divalent cation tolerance protein
MKNSRDFVVVLVTAPNRKVARALAQSALETRLTACANLVSQIESRYWWQGRMEASREVLLVFKTMRPKLRALEALVLRQHPYDTPEFLVLTLNGGNSRYLDWLAGSLRGPANKARRAG